MPAGRWSTSTTDAAEPGRYGQDVGFLDRFAKTPDAPDAFLKEVLARLRARPDVASVEAVDADTVAIGWRDRPGSEEVTVGALRGPWKQASGFYRIELLDDFMADLAPGAPSTGDAPLGVEPESHVDAEVHPEVHPDPHLPGEDDWVSAAPGLVAAVRRAGIDDGAVTWPVGDLLDGVAVSAADGSAVTDTDCGRWGVSPFDVQAVAIENLSVVDPAPDPVGPDARAWVATEPAGRQAGWLAAPGRLLERCGVTTAIVLAPLPGELVVVDPADAELVRSILTSTLQIVAAETEILCPVPFLVTADEVVAWAPGAGDPAAADLVARARAAWDR